jgi:RNA polymerase sigma-70 factor (ECF subfamily)
LWAHERTMSEDISPTRLSTDELFRAHAPFVARMLYRLGVAPAELEDVLQEVFVVVHRLGGYVRGPATPTSYLGSIAIRAAASWRRRDNTQRARSSAHSPDELAAGSQDTVRMLELREDARQLERALARVDPKLRAVLVLVDLEGESCSAIAASEHIPVGTVYWRLHRARRKFHQAVERMNAAERLRARACAEGRSP